MPTPLNIRASLEKLFDEGNRFVFWQDPDREFEESLETFRPEGITIIRLNREPALAVKARLELKEPAGRFLLYQPGPRPDPEKDWFLDVRHYAAAFAADRATMHLRELGLRQRNLRDHLALRAAFLANRERLERLKRLVRPDDGPDAVDRAIMAILANADRPDFFNITIAVLQGLDGEQPDTLSAPWADLEKYGLTATFWRMAEERFEYREETPGLDNLLTRLMTADLGKSLHGGLPEALRHLALPARGSASAVVCLSQWRDSVSRSIRYEALSDTVARRIRLDEHLSGLSIEDLAEVRTFLSVEKRIASRLRDRVMETAGAINLDEIRNTITFRQDGYWATDRLPSTEHAPRRALHRVYDALAHAAGLFHLRNTLGTDGLRHPDAECFHRAYTRDLYRVDQLYRLFHEASGEASRAGWDILKPLRPEVEACYGNWFIRNLSLNWGSLAEGLIRDGWRIRDVPGQQDFHRLFVDKVISGKRDNRLFVIISDAFRYEAARELTDELNGTYRLTAELHSLLGVLPSHTALGMAALLPHTRLDYDGSAAVRADGQSTSGLEQRKKILARVQGTAIRAEDLMAMKKTAGREFIRRHRLVTIYHNRIDATGDARATEKETFAAVRETIDELATLVSKIVNDLNGSQLLVTADHGFLFQMAPAAETDKNTPGIKPEGTVLSKKRYLLGRNLPADSMAIRGSTGVTAATGDSLDFWIPQGANRFHFVGGSRFVHGGAMLQEIVVPVIRIRQAKGKSMAATRIRSVGISLLGNAFKITTSRHRFVLIQNETISERVKPLSVRVAVYEGEHPVTNVEAMTFDSPSKDLNEWRKEVWLTLAGRTFDKKHRYRFIARNAGTGVEELSMDVTIDLAYSNDF